MIPDDKVRELVRAFIEKTKARAIKWEQAPSGDRDLEYQCQFPSSNVVLEYNRPEVEGDFILLTIKNKSWRLSASYAQRVVKKIGHCCLRC